MLGRLVRLLDVEVPRPGWRDTFDDWMSAIHADLHRPLDENIRAAASEVAEILLCDPEAVPEALRRMGSRLGEDGWTIEQIQRWLDLLARLVDRASRRRLQSFGAQAALAEGWGNEVTRGAGDERYVDPSSGLATAWVLHERVREAVAECVAGGATPAQALCLVVAEPPVDNLGPLRREAAMALLGRLISDVFDGDETIVRHRNRVIVLAGNTPPTGWRALHVERLARDPLSGIPGETIVWIDQLPDRAEDVSPYLRDLLGPAGGTV